MIGDQNTNVASGIGSSPAFFGSSCTGRDEEDGVRTRSTIWMIGSERRVVTATVFFVRLPLPFRAAGREVITLDRIQLPWSDSVRARLYGSRESTVNVGNLIPLLRPGSAV
jgi:hypothetical protein